MSTIKVNTIQDASGNNPSTAVQLNQGRAKAWYNLNAVPAESERDSFNMSSFTDNGNGNFTMNFETDMPNANYVVSVNVSRGANSSTDICNWGGVHTKTVANFGLGVWQTNSGFSSSSSRGNLCTICDVVVFGD